MTSSRKQPGVAFWASVVVVVGLVGYLLRFGAYFKWGSISWPKRPHWVQSAGRRVYWPLTGSARKSPTFRRAMNWYMSFWKDAVVDWDYRNPDDP